MTRTDTRPRLPDPSALTPEWFHQPGAEESVAAADPAVRAALLLEADRRREAGPVERDVAYRIYCAAHSDVSADGASSRIRIDWVLSNAPFVLPGLAPLMRAALPDLTGEKRAQCVMLLSRALEMGGAAAEARDVARSELRALRGSGTRAEAIVTLGAARVASGQRAYSDALALSRRGIEICADLDDPLLFVQHHLVRSAVLEALSDIVRMERSLAEVDRVLPRLAEGPRRTFTRVVAARRASARIDDDDFAGGLSALDALDAVEGPAVDPITLQSIVLMRARALAGLGRIAEAQETLDRARSIAAPHLMNQFGVGWAVIAIAGHRGDAATADAEAARLLALIDGPGRADLTAHARFEYALLVAGIAGGSMSSIPTLRAADLAAEALHETLRELDRAEADSAEPPGPEDLEILREHRTRMKDSGHDVLEFVRTGLEARLRAGDPDLLRRLTAECDGVSVCAWCCRIAAEDRWLPMAQVLTDDLLPSITHGICPECAARL